MMRTIDQDWERKLDEFNSAQGGPSRVAICYDPKIERWTVWAIPIQDSHHPLGRNKNVQILLRSFPDGSGRQGVRIFIWCDVDDNGRDIGYRALDDRVFEALRYADTFSDKDHFEKVFTEPDMRRERNFNKFLREIAYAARSYWFTLDRLAVNPHVKGPGDWRHRIR